LCVRWWDVVSKWGSYASPVVGGGGRRAATEIGEEAGERLSRQAVRNPIPRRAARVIPLDPEQLEKVRKGELPYQFLGRPNAEDVFITAAADIRHIKTARGLAKRLTLLDYAGNLDIRPKLVLEFDTPLTDIASPVFRTTPGFVGRGRTAGGAREFVIPNRPLSELKNLKWRLVP
jgi:hypothetical protein